MNTRTVSVSLIFSGDLNDARIEYRSVQKEKKSDLTIDVRRNDFYGVILVIILNHRRKCVKRYLIMDLDRLFLCFSHAIRHRYIWCLLSRYFIVGNVFIIIKCYYLNHNLSYNFQCFLFHAFDFIFTIH